MLLKKLSQTKLALGSDTTLCIITDDNNDSIEIMFNELWKQVFGFERRFSRFLPESELSMFNRSSGVRTSVSDEFRDILLTAKQFSTETGGLFNPFITPALQKAGYIKSAVPGYEHDAQIDYTDRRVVAIDQLEVDGNLACIPYGTALDMGGLGKGYLADILVRTMNKYNVVSYCLSLGGDMITKGLDENGKRMTVDIQNANSLNTTTDWVINCSKNGFAVATSGSIRRLGQENQDNWHHIIDPNTLIPAETDIILATVCSDSATRSDVLASCAVILGSKKAPDFLQRHEIKSALLQCIDKNNLPYEIVFGRNIRKERYYQSRKFATNA